jgi:hypothetical protein
MGDARDDGPRIILRTLIPEVTLTLGVGGPLIESRLLVGCPTSWRAAALANGFLNRVSQVRFQDWGSRKPI